MPRRSLPKMCMHKASGRAVVYWRGRCQYLGEWGTPEATRRYGELVRKIEAERDPLRTTAQEIALGELLERWVATVAGQFGARHQKAYAARHAALAVCADFAAIPAADFGPRRLKAVQEALLAEGRLSRAGVNARVQKIRQAFAWAVSEELVPASMLEALRTVPPLRYGRGREMPVRMPADAASFEAVVRELSARGNRGAARILRFLRATGCRPGEAFVLTPADLRLGGERPAAIPSRHKGLHLGMARVIPLNAAAVAVVNEALAESARTDGPLFPNSEGNPWRRNSLLLAVRRVLQSRPDLRYWSPYQLRHLAASESLARTGSETGTAAMLGHAPDSKIIRRYTRQREALAFEAAQAVGATA